MRLKLTVMILQFVYLEFSLWGLSLGLFFCDNVLSFSCQLIVSESHVFSLQSMQVFPYIFIMDIILEALYFFKCLNLKHLPKKIPKFSINSIREELKTNYIFLR